MRIENDHKLDFSDVLFRPKRNQMSSRAEVDLKRNVYFKHAKQYWNGVPIMTSNMDTVGTFEMYDILKKHDCLTCFHKFYSVEEFANHELDKDRYILSTGIRSEDKQKTRHLIDLLDPKFLCIDVANGYSSKFHDAVRLYREEFPSIVLIGGNVVTSEMVEELSTNDIGLDVVKIGLGNGSVCTTRLKTGVGYPQLSAVIECADAAHGMGTHIISDGGVCNAGDFSKAFGAGADFVMSGSMFAGHYECSGNIIQKDGNEFLEYYGMSSSTAMKKHYGGVASYRSSEGKKTLIPIKGHVHDTILDILGGIRSTCTYIGARKIKDIPKCTTFLKVNRQVNTLFK